MLTWETSGSTLGFGSPMGPVDLSDAGEAFDLVLQVRAPDGSAQSLKVESNCTTAGGCAGSQVLPVSNADWSEARIPLACIGIADVTSVPLVAAFSMDGPGQVAIADLKLEPRDEAAPDCARE